MLFGKEQKINYESKNLLIYWRCFSGVVNKETEATIISIFSGVIAIVGLILFYQRFITKKTKNQLR